jgi:hypothetical protein
MTLSVPRSIIDNRFISKKIKQYIETHHSGFKHLQSGSILLFNATRDDVKEAKEIYKQVKSLSREKDKKIKCYLYLLDFPKQLDMNKDNITCDECNSGSTSFYNDYREVFIWRREEWQKVFYHELIHAFGIDRDILRGNDKKDSLIYNYFRHYNGSIHEAYTEIMATLLYINRYSKSLKDQNIFLGTQVNKIVQFMEKQNKQNKQNSIKKFFLEPSRILDNSTNTSSYYILKSIYLWNSIYRNKMLASVENMMDKEFINDHFYDIFINTLKDKAYFHWLEKIYFDTKNTSLKLTI